MNKSVKYNLMETQNVFTGGVKKRFSFSISDDDFYLVIAIFLIEIPITLEKGF